MSHADGLIKPQYGSRSLSDLSQTLLNELDIPSSASAIELGVSVKRWVVLLVDGLGALALDEHAKLAPTLVPGLREPLTCGLPATTVTSLASFGTGAAPGSHGLLGYTAAAGNPPKPFNLLRWLWCDGAATQPLPDPVQFQAHSTIFERAGQSGVSLAVVNRPEYRNSPYSRATLRGAEYIGATDIDEVMSVSAERIRTADRGLVYAYHPGLDAATHVHGVGSDAWCAELKRIDAAVSCLLKGLPQNVGVIVTADHGAINAGREDTTNLDECPELLRDVDFISGEARMRYVHCKSDCADEVLQRWQNFLGDEAYVMGREQACNEGWFGPEVRPELRKRLGEVVVLMKGNRIVVQPSVDAEQAAMVGHHGSATPQEQLIPLAVLQS